MSGLTKWTPKLSVFKNWSLRKELILRYKHLHENIPITQQILLIDSNQLKMEIMYDSDASYLSDDVTSVNIFNEPFHLLLDVKKIITDKDLFINSPRINKKRKIKENIPTWYYWMASIGMSDLEMLNYLYLMDKPPCWNNKKEEIFVIASAQDLLDVGDVKLIFVVFVYL